MPCLAALGYESHHFVIASPPCVSRCESSGTDPVLRCMFDHCLLQQDSVPAGRYNTKPRAKSAEAMQAVPGSLHHLLSQGQLIPFHFLREMTGGSP